MNNETAKQIVSRLYEFQGADFTQDLVKFRFTESVHHVVHELRMNGIIVTQDALQFGNTSAMFVGVTFESGEDFPEYKFARIMKNW